MTTLDAPAGDAPAFEVPTSMSPSRVESFTSCPMAFRFASIERVRDPPNVHTTRGSLVHRALELGYLLARRTANAPLGSPPPSIGRSPSTAACPTSRCSGSATTRRRGSSPHAIGSSTTTCAWRTRSTIRPIGLELRLSAQVGELSLRGIIDRLELRDGGLVVTDYKTGRPPSSNWELRSLAGVHFYAFLCEQVFGQLPGRRSA